MTPDDPQGVDTLMARMPRWFLEHAKKTERRANRRREALAKRFEQEAPRSAAHGSPSEDWQDTVIDYRELP